MKPKLIVIVGATATGKSYCALELAKILKTDIISGDSMLVFNDMNIATAKPTCAELESVKHHLVNILPPSGSFNVVDFKNQAEVIIKKLNSEHKIPILAGGTGLYIKALLENYTFSNVSEITPLRKELEKYLQENGKTKLHDKLKELDPITALRLNENDTRRVIRAIETSINGEAVSQEKSNESPYDFIVFGLNMNRKLLYERINKRVDIMVENGVFEETKKFIDAGIPLDCQAMQSIGYRQIAEFYTGKYSKKEAIDKLKQATRNFAKRQLTWYRKMPYINWIDVEEYQSYEKIVKIMLDTLVKKYELE